MPMMVVKVMMMMMIRVMVVAAMMTMMVVVVVMPMMIMMMMIRVMVVAAMMTMMVVVVVMPMMMIMIMMMIRVMVVSRVVVVVVLVVIMITEELHGCIKFLVGCWAIYFNNSVYQKECELENSASYDCFTLVFHQRYGARHSKVALLVYVHVLTKNKQLNTQQFCFFVLFPRW